MYKKYRVDSLKYINDRACIDMQSRLTKTII